MECKQYFIKATEKYNELYDNVPAYYFRRAFFSEEKRDVRLKIAVCGFYELYLNGERITRGFLSPYISNTDHYIYFDEYSVSIGKGENVIGVILGNGFQNNPGGYVWDFDKSPFRSSPCFALTVYDKEKLLLHSGDGFKIMESAIRSDDYRFGEYYDANFEIDGWAEVGFDDSLWSPALTAVSPNGELRIADVPPIVKETEIKPQEVFLASDGGYIYDFGVCNTGICRLTVKGEKGQKIEIRHADCLENGDLNIHQIWFPDHEREWHRDKDNVHKDTYVCKGEGIEVYEPRFTYHGFRYAKVSGITEEQATGELLTYLVYHTELNTRGDFESSDATLNKLQEMTRRSIVSNFHHIPTDCPQREKNGWTADAALSCEAALINFDPERSYREWQRNICKAQREDGMIPGIVPTGGWGYSWGNGPAWDCVLAYLPYFVYVYRGETKMITESASALLTYLRYLRNRTDERGLLEIGLGDWCHIGRIPPKAPLVLTDTLISMDIADKIALMLEAVGMYSEADYARCEKRKYREAIRKNLIDLVSMIASGDCQSSQAMCLYYGAYDKDEEARAFEYLLELIHRADDHIDIGVLGGRVLFHVLSRFGYGELAFKMITREDYPSFGNWIKRGATTLWEDFFPDKVNSMNHHFWGDISAWFIKRITGIIFNPSRTRSDEVLIAPDFIGSLDYASAYHIAPKGKISVCWRREDGGIIVEVGIPKEISATLLLPDGYRLVSGESGARIVSGSYKVLPV